MKNSRTETKGAGRRHYGATSFDPAKKIVVGEVVFEDPEPPRRKATPHKQRLGRGDVFVLQYFECETCNREGNHVRFATSKGLADHNEFVHNSRAG